MNAIINENNSFVQLINKLCDKVSGNRYVLKKENGEGFMELVPVMKGIDFIYTELTLLEPVMVKWEFENNENETFYLIHVESTRVDTSKEMDFNLAEEGTSVISQNNHRQVLWMPNIKYKIISVRFSLDWIKFIDKMLKLPSNARSFINGDVDLMLLQVKKNEDIKQVIEQIVKYKEIVSIEARDIYLHSKITELLMIMFNLTLPITFNKKEKHAVHIEDYKNIINFTNDFLVNKVVPEKIEVVASRFGMSRSKFQRVFKMIKSQTYYSFVLDVRMVKAMELLMENKLVTEVADVTGYSSISSFTHAFFNYYKMRPLEIRNR